MTEPTPGPLDRLRAANPVPHAVSQPEDTTLEEILMTVTESPAGPTTPSPMRKKLPLLLGVAAALLLVGGVVGALASNNDDKGVDTGEVAGPAGDDPAADPVTDPAAGSDGIGDSSQVTSCVETYSPETLTNREYAFDGTVTDTDAVNMTFSVNEWFSDGTDATVTLKHQDYAGMLLDPNTSLDVGTRVLIAGDGGFVWSCGFTQLRTDESAAEWRGAFG